MSIEGIRSELLGEPERKKEGPVMAAARRNSVLRTLLATASVIVILAGIKAASAIVTPALLALMVTFVSLPFFSWLRRRHVWTWLAALLTILADVAVLAAGGFLLTGSMNELARELPKYREQLDQLSKRSIEWLVEHDVPVDDWFEVDVAPAELPVVVRGGSPAPDEPIGGDPAIAMGEAPSWWMSFFDLGAMLELANRAVRGVAAAVSTAIIVLFITTFILLEVGTFRDKLRIAFGNREWADRLGRITLELRRYLVIKFWISLATGTWLGIWVALLGLDFPFLWGVIAFAMNFIPNIGSILASFPPIVLGLVQGGPFLALMVAIAFLTVNMLLGNLLEPQLQGRRLGLSTLVVFLSLMFWGWLLGPVGMLLSVPLTTAARIVFEHVDGLRWAAVLLGDAPHMARRRRMAARREAAAAAD